MAVREQSTATLAAKVGKYAQWGTYYQCDTHGGDIVAMTAAYTEALDELLRRALIGEKMEAREKWAAEKYGADTIEYRAVMGVEI